jgi:hypothetical protein
MLEMLEKYVGNLHTDIERSRNFDAATANLRKGCSKAMNETFAPRRLVMKAPKSLRPSACTWTASPSMSALSVGRPETPSAIPQNRMQLDRLASG